MAGRRANSAALRPTSIPSQISTAMAEGEVEEHEFWRCAKIRPSYREARQNKKALNRVHFRREWT